jgi:hypothetical protein
VRKEGGIKVLDEFDPARTAGGHHGQGTAIACPLEEFMTFFKDRQIGCEVCIEDSVKTQASKGCNHLARYERARR